MQNREVIILKSYCGTLRDNNMGRFNDQAVTVSDLAWRTGLYVAIKNPDMLVPTGTLAVATWVSQVFAPINFFMHRRIDELEFIVPMGSERIPLNMDKFVRTGLDFAEEQLGARIDMEPLRGWYVPSGSDWGERKCTYSITVRDSREASAKFTTKITLIDPAKKYGGGREVVNTPVGTLWISSREPLLRQRCEGLTHNKFAQTHIEYFYDIMALFSSLHEPTQVLTSTAPIRRQTTINGMEVYRQGKILLPTGSMFRSISSDTWKKIRVLMNNSKKVCVREEGLGGIENIMAPGQNLLSILYDLQARDKRGELSRNESMLYASVGGVWKHYGSDEIVAGASVKKPAGTTGKTGTAKTTKQTGKTKDVGPGNSDMTVTDSDNPDLTEAYRRLKKTTYNNGKEPKIYVCDLGYLDIDLWGASSTEAHEFLYRAFGQEAEGVALDIKKAEKNKNIGAKYEKKPAYVAYVTVTWGNGKMCNIVLRYDK